MKRVHKEQTKAESGYTNYRLFSVYVSGASILYQIYAITTEVDEE
jgi:hypothetical protein